MTKTRTFSITRTIQKHGNLYPPTLNLMKSLPDMVFTHSLYQLEHPRRTFSQSTDKIFESALDLLTRLTNYQLSPPIAKTNSAVIIEREIILAQEQLLSAIMSFIDSCYQILKATTPPPTTIINTPFNDKWLEKANHPSVLEFKRNISFYREMIAPIFNKIKHQNGRLVTLRFYNDQSTFALGYFLEGVDAKGRVGPDETTHKGGRTAFSFNRDIRFHLCHVYKVSEYLNNALHKSIKIYYRHSAVLGEMFARDSAKIENMLSLLNQLPYNFFPDELAKPTPEINLLQSSFVNGINIKYPGSVVPNIPGSMNIESRLYADEDTRVFRIPYHNPA